MVSKPKTMVSPPFANSSRLIKTPMPGHLSDLFAGGASFGVAASKQSARRCVLTEPHLLHIIEQFPVELIALKTISNDPPALLVKET